MRIALIMIALTYMPSLTPAWSQSSARGILGKEAPAWGVKEWINLPEGQTTLDINDYKGKVVYLYGFQSWCPGCHSHGFPTLKTLLKHYGKDKESKVNRDSKDNKDIAFVAIQTVFEGYSTNNAQAAWRTADRYDLKIPVGHDGSNGKRSLIMKRYRTGGTPWTIIIDKQGVVRYNDFHIKPEQAIKIINRLRAEQYSPKTTLHTPPASDVPPTTAPEELGNPVGVH